MATRYWVGGTGTWDSTSTTNWSTTSGGAGGASAPLATDDVVIDDNSGTGTCTTAATAVARIVTLNSQTCGLTLGANLTLGPELTGASAYNLIVSGGALNLNNYTLTSPRISFSQTTNTRSVAFGASGKLVSNYGNNTYIGFQFQVGTGFTYTGTSRIEFTYSGGNTISAYLPRTSSGGTSATALNYYFTATAGTIKLDAGSGAVVANNIDFTGCTGTLTNTNLNVYGNITYASGMTLTAGTFVTSFVGTSGTQQITTAGKTLDFPITFNGIGGTFAFQDALTQGSTRAFTVTNGTVQLKAGATSIVGSFATSGTNQKYLQSTLAGSQATLSDASGTNSLSYTTIQDIFATGGATWNAYYANGNIDGGNNTNWNFGGTPSYDAEYGYKLRPFTETGRF